MANNGFRPIKTGVSSYQNNSNLPVQERDRAALAKAPGRRGAMAAWRDSDYITTENPKKFGIRISSHSPHRRTFAA
jgi:hypothetical protein